jgi:hypothetical protein
LISTDPCGPGVPISTGCIAALLLNLLFNAMRKQRTESEPTVGGDTVAVVSTAPGTVPENRLSAKDESETIR